MLHDPEWIRDIDRYGNGVNWCAVKSRIGDKDVKCFVEKREWTAFEGKRHRGGNGLSLRSRRIPKRVRHKVEDPEEVLNINQAALEGTTKGTISNHGSMVEGTLFSPCEANEEDASELDDDLEEEESPSKDLHLGEKRKKGEEGSSSLGSDSELNAVITGVLAQVEFDDDGTKGTVPVNKCVFVPPENIDFAFVQDICEHQLNNMKHEKEKLGYWLNLYKTMTGYQEDEELNEEDGSTEAGNENEGLSEEAGNGDNEEERKDIG